MTRPTTSDRRHLIACLLLCVSSAAAAQQNPAPSESSDSSTALDALLAGSSTDSEGEKEQAVSDKRAPVAEAASELESIPVQPLKSEPETSPSPNERRPPTQIEEIVVTATKREQSLREIPASITALTGENLEQLGVQGVEDISRLVPGVTIYSPSEGATRVTIRGIAAPAATNATTGALFGDVSFTDAYLPRAALDPNPFDLKSVEVLKGPQGTLFGAGALNGAIRYVPEPPKLGEWEAKAFLQYTSIDEGDTAPIYGAMVNLPFAGDSAAMRVMGFDRVSPGYIDNSQLGEDVNEVTQQGLRGILAWEPSEDWRTALTYAWQRTEQADFPIADNLDGRLNTDNRPRHSTADIEYSLVDLVVARRFSWGELISDTSYVDKSVQTYFDASSRLPGDGEGALRAGQPDQSASDTWAQELRLVSEDTGSPWIWTIGAFGWKQDVQSRPDLTASFDLENGLAGLPPALATLLEPLGLEIVDDRGEVLLIRINTQAEIRELALFGDLTRRIGESIELTLGGRLYRITSGGKVNFGGALGPTQPPRDGELKEQGFNPKVSLLWHALEDIRLFAAVSQGFRAGGIQPGYRIVPTNPAPPEFFKSDTILSYEAGVRSDWFEGAMHLDLTAFFTDWKDAQAFQVGNSGLTSYIDNAGGVESKGIEAALQTLLPWGFMFNAAVSVTDTVTTEPFTAQDGSVVPPGREWTFAPQFQSAATLAWNGTASDWGVTTSLTHSFLGEAWSGLEDSLRRPIYDFSQWDFQLGLTHLASQWVPEVSFIVNNLTDERGVANQFDGGSYVDVTYIRPRAYTLRLTTRF